MNKLREDKEKSIKFILLLLVASLIFIKIYEKKTKKFDIIDDRLDMELEEELLALTDNEEEEAIEEFKLEEIMVHISGQVNNPGLVVLTSKDRVKDAINMAGGLKEEADLDNINLAKKLKDEDKIYIPKIGEEGIFIEASGSISTGEEAAEGGLININTCTKDELVSLPGIGDKTAEKIIDYREDNLFGVVDDIMNVSGIGNKKFEDIKERIIVN